MRRSTYSGNYKIHWFVPLFIFMIFPWSGTALGGVADHIAEGDKAVVKGDFSAAEKAFSKALEMDPGNYRILRSLAESKISLNKYDEADALIDEILAMKVTMGKRVMVTMEDVPEPLEAELVDETVVESDSGKNNMRNYLDLLVPDVEPAYRLFFFKTGKMELIAKSRARIQYLGVPRRDREEILELQRQVKDKVIAAKGVTQSLEMVKLKGGCFQMGSKNGEPDEQPVHEVCISPFQIDPYEVNQASFQAKMGTNPSRFKSADLPVESVTWLEAEKYCQKVGKRLPTEAEWEFAARGGTATPFYWGDEVDVKKANFCDASCDLNIRFAEGSDGFKYTAPVGKFPANPYGLHDMAGNVAEWLADWMEENYYRVSPKKDPKGPERKGDVLRGGVNVKVIRGGGWDTDSGTLRSANRKGFWVDYRVEGIGFRCAAEQS